MGYANKDTAHYQGRGGVEPIDFIMSNKMGFAEGSAIKYIYRAPLKGTPIEDLDKAIDYCKMLKKQYEPRKIKPSRIEKDADVYGYWLGA